MTQGLLVALMFICTVTFSFFPAIMDATDLNFMAHTVKKNEEAWF